MVEKVTYSNKSKICRINYSVNAVEPILAWTCEIEADEVYLIFALQEQMVPSKKGAKVLKVFLYLHMVHGKT